MKKFKQFVAESSLSRILQHISSTENFGVMSAYRKEKSDDQNKADHKQLKASVRKRGYGFIELRGGYDGDEGFFSEQSLFIPNIKRSEIIELGKQYDQHSVIHKDKENFALIGTNASAGIGKTLDKFETGKRDLSIDDVGDKFVDFFSRLEKGSHSSKKFLFKMQEMVETSMYYKMKHGTEWKTIYETNK